MRDILAWCKTEVSVILTPLPMTRIKRTGRAGRSAPVAGSGEIPDKSGAYL